MLDRSQNEYFLNRERSPYSSRKNISNRVEETLHYCENDQAEQMAAKLFEDRLKINMVSQHTQKSPHLRMSFSGNFKGEEKFINYHE